MRPSILYTSFDEVPAPKGASTHILALTAAIGKQIGSVLLVTPGPADREGGEIMPGVRQIVLGCPDDNVIGRARTFRRKLDALLLHRSFDVIHFRSIFEGIAVCNPALRGGARLIYEANGFPSIEMPYRYPRLRNDTALLAKLRSQEMECLGASDRIVTVSRVTADLVRRRLAKADSTGATQNLRSISVIPNGFHPEAIEYKTPSPAPAIESGEPLKIIYVGTLSWWQGIDVLLEAVGGVNKQRPCRLHVVGPGSHSRMKQLKRKMARSQLTDRVTFSTLRSQSAVAAALHDAHLVVAPLMTCRRNNIQGCCPIKVIEGMAAGTPLIASDLPVVRELGNPGEHYIAARPGDAGNLKNLILETSPAHADNMRMSRAAREHVERNFTWERATESVCEIYRMLLAESRVS